MDTLVRVDVWSDYACRSCFLEESVLNRLQKEFGEALEVRWRAFELHPPSTRKALEAVEFARENGVFAIFHDELFHAYFDKGRDLAEPELLMELADTVGLDRGALARALEDDRFADVVEADLEEARARGIHEVPALLISSPGGGPSVLLEGAQSYDSLRHAIERVQQLGAPA